MCPGISTCLKCKQAWSRSTTLHAQTQQDPGSQQPSSTPAQPPAHSSLHSPLPAAHQEAPAAKRHKAESGQASGGGSQQAPSASQTTLPLPQTSAATPASKCPLPQPPHTPPRSRTPVSHRSHRSRCSAPLPHPCLPHSGPRQTPGTRTTTPPRRQGRPALARRRQQRRQQRWRQRWARSQPPPTLGRRQRVRCRPPRTPTRQPRRRRGLHCRSRCSSMRSRSCLPCLRTSCTCQTRSGTGRRLVQRARDAAAVLPVVLQLLWLRTR